MFELQMNQQDTSHHGTDCKKQKKIDAERQRRKAINARLVRLRQLLNLDEQVTRLEVLTSAGEIVRQSKSNHDHNLDLCQKSVSLSQGYQNIRKNSTISDRNEGHPYEFAVPDKSAKASIEQYRRLIERQQYDQIQSLLGVQKTSDIQLLDSLIDYIRNQIKKTATEVGRYSNQESGRIPLCIIHANSGQKSLTRTPKKADGLHPITDGKENAVDQFWRPWESQT